MERLSSRNCSAFRPRLAALRRENQRLIDAYQAGVIELDNLKEWRE